MSGAFVIADEEGRGFWQRVEPSESEPGEFFLFISFDHRCAARFSSLAHALALIAFFPEQGSRARILHYPSMCAAVIQHTKGE